MSFEGEVGFTLMQEIETTTSFSKALKPNSQVVPTRNFAGGVKTAWLYMLQIYSWT